MNEPKIMTRAEAFSYVDRFARAALGGQPLPEPLGDKDHMRADDMGDAMAAFGRELSQRLSKIPTKITDNVKVQEMLHQHFDEVLSDLAAKIEATVAIYKD